MMSAYVFVQTALASGGSDLGAMHKALHGVAGVKSVHLLAGPTDMIVFVEAPDQAGLMDALGKIRAVRGVGSTDTRIVWPM